MADGHQYINPENREDAILKLDDYIRGNNDYPNVLENYDNLEFQQLKADTDSSIRSGTPANRPEVFFKMALLRSLRYSVVNGVYCHSHGNSTERRQLYEGQRLMHPYKR